MDNDDGSVANRNESVLDGEKWQLEDRKWGRRELVEEKHFRFIARKLTENVDVYSFLQSRIFYW